MKVLALVALATLASALPDMFMGRRKGGFTSHLHENNRVDPSLLLLEHIGVSNITQKLDHFDASNKNTWAQRYFYNHIYVNDTTVNILYISGEQTGDINTIIGKHNAYEYYAEVMNADLYALEHRFYGESHPTEDTSVENLKYLSSRQAIEDIAEFIRQINAEKGGDQQWIVVGGSYAGSLSAWSRLLHPELISGSIASSAPILAQLDFYGYLQTVDEDFKTQGGFCYAQLEAGLEEARQLFQSEEGREKIAFIFQLPPADLEDPSEYDKDLFFSHLISPFSGSAQYNTPALDSRCTFFTANGENHDALFAFRFGGFNVKFEINFTATVEQLAAIEYDGDISDRLWMYQTCAEFGYFRSTNKGENVFGQTQSSNYFIEYCVKLFGIDADQIQKNVEATNQLYGGRDYYAGTNVIFTHGTQDPWSFLTKKSDPKHWSVVIAEVEGGSHCQDIGQSCFDPSLPCNDNMMQIQTMTLENMKKWVDPIFPVPDRVEISDSVGKRPQLFDPIVSPSLQVNGNVPVPAKLRAKRSPEMPKSSKKIDFRKWNKFTGKGRKGLLSPPVSVDAMESGQYGPNFIEQTWDHFNPNEERTFKQKWYFNYKFGSKDGPNFLMIGGEGPEDSSWIASEKVDWTKNAKEVGANLFLLEHRYYGESKLGTNDLQYLTSAQMLYDVATFIRTQQLKQGLTGPWITFGGSYPGALAAWSREWFPELILGAVGSSGPVLAKNDFYEYLEVVEDVIKRQSQKCYDRTAEAFETLHKLSQNPDGRAVIQEKFNLSPAWSDDANETISALDLNEVFSALSGMYMGTVQYNSVDWSDVANLCSFFEDDSIDSLDALSALRNNELMYGDYEINSSYDDDIESLAQMKNFVDGHDDTFDDDYLAGILWMWQTCNEFGYYQTTDYGDGIFGTPVPLNFFITMCERVFGVGIDSIEKSISRTNYQYGGRNRYNTTNVVLPNGDGDPWHALGIFEQGNMDASVVPILIKGTSHCADMYGPTKDDPPELTQARVDILANIKKWLAPAPPTSTPSPTSSPTPSPTTQKTTTVAPTVSPTQTSSPTVSPTTSIASSSAGFLAAIVSLLFVML